VVPHQDLEAVVGEIAGRLAKKPVLALAAAKQALRRSLSADLEEMLDLEVRTQSEALRSADALEGARAFLEKREPRFGAGPAGVN